MDSVNDDAKGGGYRRIEVLTGPGRRRKWSDDDTGEGGGGAHPTKQLAGVFRAAGDPDRADAVLYAARDREMAEDWRTGNYLGAAGLALLRCTGRRRRGTTGRRPAVPAPHGSGAAGNFEERTVTLSTKRMP
jgi:hypothetical protein